MPDLIFWRSGRVRYLKLDSKFPPEFLFLSLYRGNQNGHYIRGSSLTVYFLKRN